jgi:hypothetical protein
MEGAILASVNCIGPYFFFCILSDPAVLRYVLVVDREFNFGPQLLQSTNASSGVSIQIS